MDGDTLAWIGLALFIASMYALSNWWGKAMGYKNKDETKNTK